jgi:UDP-glucose 4-epimerase
MRAFITGGAGFIGSNMANRLVADGHEVVVFDNLSTGHREFLQPSEGKPNFRFAGGSLANPEEIAAAMKGCDTVFHFAANADVRHGTEKPRRDLEQNIIATFNLLEAMRSLGVPRIMFSSTSAIYGETTVIPTPETAPFPIQTSLYGASKLSGEGLIQAYCEGYGMQGFIFRFVSILGEHYNHGHIYDFYQKLRNDPTRLTVLGNGAQKKSYLYVQDCVDGVLLALEKATGKVNILNLGTEECTDVRFSLGCITERLGIKPKLEFTGGDRGWIGDNPLIFLDCKKAGALGWKPKLTIREGIIRTLEYLMQNPWLFEKRG